MRDQGSAPLEYSNNISSRKTCMVTAAISAGMVCWTVQYASAQRSWRTPVLEGGKQVRLRLVRKLVS
eukprot:6469023-Amphidinium_carterae.1